MLCAKVIQHRCKVGKMGVGELGAKNYLLFTPDPFSLQGKEVWSGDETGVPRLEWAVMYDLILRKSPG